MSFSTVCRLVRKLSADVGPVIGSHKSDTSKYASSPKLVDFFSKIRRKLYFSAECGHGWNFKSICIALLAKYFKTEKKSTRGAPHLLNDEKHCMHVRTVRKLLKRFPRYDQIMFMNLVVGDESRIHYFEPHQKLRN